MVAPGPITRLRPAARTVAPPRPSTVAVPDFEVEQQGRVRVDAQHEDVIGQLSLEAREAALAEVAEARVVGATLGVVVVGDDGHAQAQGSEDVEPIEPVGVRTDLVDLVDRDRVGAQRQGGGAGERDDARALQVRRQHRREPRRPPPLEGVARTPRSREHEVGFREARQRAGFLDRVRVRPAEVDGGHRQPDVRREVVQRAGGDLVGVLLERVRRRDERRARGPALDHGREAPMDLRHRGRGLAGAHEREQSRAAHRRVELEQEARELHRPLGVDVVVRALEPGDASSWERLERGLDLLGLRDGATVVGAVVAGGRENDRIDDPRIGR